MLDFIKPNDSPLLISLMQGAWSALSFLRIFTPRICVKQNLIDTFERLHGQRTIICPNHPAPSDGMVIFGLSAILHETFAILAARDIFGNSNSFQAKWLQKLGCYSVSRGMADLHAFKSSCELLYLNKRKIVIFPEGEISHNNSALKSFHKGPELIALSTLHTLREKESTVKVYLLPLALKYKYERDISKCSTTIDIEC